MGKRGIGTMFSQLIMAAIVFGVVIVALQITKGTAYAAEKIEDITGVGIGTPRLSSFAAEPAEGVNMQFKFTVPGDKSGAELLIYRSYEPYPDKEPGTPQFDSSNLVYHAISDRDTTGKKLVDVLKKTKVATVSCPSGYESGGCEEVGLSEFKPGWYKFFAVLKKDRKVVDAKDAKVGFYTEDYVELLDKPIAGCVDGFGNCNVFECKKLLVNYNLEGGALGGFVTWLGLRKNLVVDVSEDFNSKPRSAGCGSVKLGAVNYFNVDGCTKEEIHELNKMVSRIRLLEAANNFEPGISSEDQYPNYIDRLDLWKKDAVRHTLACTKSLNRVITTDPKGAYPEFVKLGWQSVGKFTYNEEVANELDRVLKEEVRPIIVKLRADAVPSDKTLALSWNLPIGQDAITMYELKLFRSYAAPKKNDASQVKNLPLVELTDVKQPGISATSATYPGNGGLSAGKMGAYLFSLAAFDKDGKSDSKDSTTGIYDNSYVELYRDLKGVDDACGAGCDVVGKKIDALANDKLGFSGSPMYVLKARADLIASGKVNGATCKIDTTKKKSTERIVGCTDKEVHELYVAVVTEYAKNLDINAFRANKRDVSMLLAVDCNSDGWMNNYEIHKKNGIKAVCNAKWSLMKSLDELKWGYAGS